MANYEIRVYVNNGTIATLPVEYEKDYELRRDITSLGVNGLLQKIDGIFHYYPPHKIEKIEVEEIKS